MGSEANLLNYEPSAEIQRKRKMISLLLLIILLTQCWWATSFCWPNFGICLSLGTPLSPRGSEWFWNRPMMSLKDWLALIHSGISPYLTSTIRFLLVCTIAHLVMLAWWQLHIFQAPIAALIWMFLRSGILTWLLITTVLEELNGFLDRTSTLNIDFFFVIITLDTLISYAILYYLWPVQPPGTFSIFSKGPKLRITARAGRLPSFEFLRR